MRFPGRGGGAGRTLMQFRFRAQAALDLRTRLLHDAQRELARAEGDRDIAHMRLRQADAMCEAARVRAADAMRGGADCTALQWYQSWIVRLDHECTSASATLALRETAVQRQIQACLEAQQRREALDRFREKARAGFDALEAAGERKLIDELATRRYSANRQSAEDEDSLNEDTRVASSQEYMWPLMQSDNQRAR